MRIISVLQVFNQSVTARVFANSEVFSNEQVAQLEQEDDETVLWKVAIDAEY